jgi:hypothetical protein
MLHFPNSSSRLAQITPQRSPKQFQQHLKANVRNHRIVPALARLISDECMLCVCDFVETERYARII